MFWVCDSHGMDSRDAVVVRPPSVGSISQLQVHEEHMVS